MPHPVTAEVFVAINGRRSDALARTTLTDPATSDRELAALFRDVADEIERQVVSPYPEAPDA